MSTCQHVVKTLRFLRLPQVTMSPPSHISSSLLLYTTGLQVNTSTKPSESYSTTGQHVLFSTTTYYRSTCRQNPKSHTLLQVTMSPPHHIYYTLLLSTRSLQVNTSSKPSKPYQYCRSPCNVPTSPYLLFSTTTYYRYTGQHVVKTLKTIPVLQINMSPPRHISYSLLQPTTGQHVVKTLRIILYCRSTCPHLATSLILYYSQQELYMSTHCQNPHNHTITTGHHVFKTSPHTLPYTGQHVTTLPYLFYYYFTTTLYQHVIKTQNLSNTTS